MISEVRELEARVKISPFANFMEIKAQADSKIAEVNHAVVTLSYQLGALIEEKKMQVKQSRKRKRAAAYAIRKVARTMQARGVSASVSKAIAGNSVTILDSEDVPKGTILDTEVFKEESIMLWSTSGKVKTAIERVLHCLDDTINLTRTALKKYKEQYPNVRRAMNPVASTLGPVIQKLKEHYLELPGGDLREMLLCQVPWIVNLSQFAPRQGPANLPFPGMPCFVKVLSGEVQLMLFNYQTVAENGPTTLSSIPGWMDEHPEFVQQAWSVQLNEEQLLWVPFGYYALIIGQHVVNEVFVWPWIAAPVLKGIEVPHFMQVYLPLLEYIHTRQDRRPWKDLAPAFQTVRELVVPEDLFVKYMEHHQKEWAAAKAEPKKPNKTTKTSNTENGKPESSKGAMPASSSSVVPQTPAEQPPVANSILQADESQDPK